jgi:hypothetical protein
MFLMADEMVKEKDVSKMFVGKYGVTAPDEELALEIIKRFNICWDTLETMPAFNEHLEPLFLKKEK